jgi:hypothetical protein
MFLAELDKIDSSGKFDWKLLNLYAKYDQGEMLPFLKRSRTYPLQEAFELCRTNLFYPEMVYLLDRMGNSTEALTIIMKKLENVKMAIEFCREHNDLELWEYLVNESVDKPEIITKLLDGVAGFMVNPEMLIDKIQVGQEIPGLKDALVKMLSGFNLQVSLGFLEFLEVSNSSLLPTGLRPLGLQRNPQDRLLRPPRKARQAARARNLRRLLDQLRSLPPRHPQPQRLQQKLRRHRLQLSSSLSRFLRAREVQPRLLCDLHLEESVKVRFSLFAFSVYRYLLFF